MTVRAGRVGARAAGLAIIVVANVFALAGAAYNRVGDPESILTLTEREIVVSSDVPRAEKSAVLLRLHWCSLDSIPQWEKDSYGFVAPNCYGHSPSWLSNAKLRELGFDTRITPRDTSQRRQWRRLPRTAFLVMEVGGPAQDEMVQRAREYLETREKAAALAPDSAPLQRQLAEVRRRFDWIENGASRLYLIDAGVDLARLRAKYPDRRRYAILRGSIKPSLQIWAKDSLYLLGHVVDISPPQINVPREHQPLLRGLVTEYDFGDRPAGPRRHVTVTVAFGRRLEPWITGVK